MKRLCLMMCVSWLILSGISKAEAKTWQVVYQTDFSTDPEWTTDQPQNFYWEAASGTYFIHQTNYPEAYEPDRYAYVRVPYSGGAFRLEWDVEMLRCDWSTGLNFGLFDLYLSFQARGHSSAAIYVEYTNPDAGRGFNLIGYQDTTYAYSNNWTRFDLNVWYHNVFEYEPMNATARWTVYRLGESTPSMENTLTGVPEITNNISYLGSSMYPMLHPWGGGVNPNAVAEARIDNVVLYAACEPCVLTGRIAFVSDDYKQLYVMDTSVGIPSAQQVPLPPLNHLNSPQWSQDGLWLTFHGGIPHHGQIYIVRPDGSGFRQLTDGSGNLVQPSFSLDGSKIVFEQVYGDMYIINTDGTGLIDLQTNGGLPRWSPDGRYIVYTQVD